MKRREGGNRDRQLISLPTKAPVVAGAPAVDFENPPDLDIPPDRLPRHVALIMDGNGRWARQNNLPRVEGHRRGARTVAGVVAECQRLGLEQVTLYCLSSENWKRPPDELRVLLDMLQQFMIEARRELLSRKIRLRVIGRREPLPVEVLDEIERTLEMTRDYSGFCLCLAINYGARQELVDAMRDIANEVAAGALRPEEIDEQAVASHLYTAGMPDPDLLIRTAGEMRVSNYLLWQISYAELWVTSRCWPEFGVEDLHQAFRDYAGRQRRFGGLAE
jgi:undecaprenyl diphosphate synthase